VLLYIAVYMEGQWGAEVGSHRVPASSTYTLQHPRPQLSSASFLSYGSDYNLDEPVHLTFGRAVTFVCPRKQTDNDKLPRHRTMRTSALFLVANPLAWNHDSPRAPSYAFHVTQGPAPSSPKPHPLGWRFGPQAPLKLAAK